MSEIVGKFVASMQGFWWSLDQHERTMIVLVAAWAGLTVLDLSAAASTRRQRLALAVELADELERRAAAV